MAADFSLVSIKVRGDYDNIFQAESKRRHKRMSHLLKSQNLNQNIFR